MVHIDFVRLLLFNRKDRGIDEENFAKRSRTLAWIRFYTIKWRLLKFLRKFPFGVNSANTAFAIQLKRRVEMDRAFVLFVYQNERCTSSEFNLQVLIFVIIVKTKTKIARIV